MQSDDILVDSLPYADELQSLEEAEKLIQQELVHVSKSTIKDTIFMSKYPLLKKYMEDVGNNVETKGIDFEKFKMEPPSNDNDWKDAVMNAKAQLEYQNNRQVNLELMAEFASNAHRYRNYELECLIKNIQAQTEQLKKETEMINQTRKQDQMHAKVQLDSIKLKQMDLIRNIIQVRMANKELEA